MFYQSQYTGLEPEANLRASRAAARRALEQFEPAERPSARARPRPGAISTPAEVEEITERYYELALILAEAVSQPLPGEDAPSQAREALQILDRVERVRPPTQVFYLRRADYLERAGDRDRGRGRARARATAAEAEQLLGRRLPGGRGGLPSARLHAGRRGLPARPDPPARPFLGPVPAGDLPPQGAPRRPRPRPR